MALTYFDETILRVGEAYVAHCCDESKRGQLAPLYAPDAVSIEPVELDNLPDDLSFQCDGIEAIQRKCDWFFSQFEVLEMSASGPYLHGDDQFGVQFSYQVKHRDSGEVFPSHELGIFTVKDGRIVKELFYQQP